MGFVLKGKAVSYTSQGGVLPALGAALRQDRSLVGPQSCTHHIHRRTYTGTHREACTCTPYTYVYTHAHYTHRHTHRDAHTCTPHTCVCAHRHRHMYTTHICAHMHTRHTHTHTLLEAKPLFSTSSLGLGAHTISYELLSHRHLKTPAQKSGYVKTPIKSFLRPILPLTQL